jgi:hypothetical protein
MMLSRHRRHHTKAGCLLLVGACFAYTVATSGQTIEKPSRPDVEPKCADKSVLPAAESIVAQYPKFVRQKLSASKVSPYLSKEDLDELQQDMEQFVKARVPSDLTQKKVAIILDGTERFIGHLRSTNTYSDLPDVWENLKWRVAAVLRAMPLTNDERSRIKEQMAYVETFVREYTTLFGGENAQDRVSLFESFCADPFVPCFKKPLNDEMWRIFSNNLRVRKEWAAKLPQKMVPNVLGAVLCDLIAVNPPTKVRPTYVEVTKDGLLVRFSHPRSPSSVTCFAYDNPPTIPRTMVGIGKARGLVDIDLSIKVSDLPSDQPIGVNAEETAVLAQRKGGDFVYAGMTKELLGLNGTEFAVIDAHTIAEVCRLSEREIRGILDMRGKKKCSLEAYLDGIAPFGGTTWSRRNDGRFDVPEEILREIPRLPKGVVLVVRNGKGRIGVLHIVAICSPDSDIGRMAGACLLMDFYSLPVGAWGLHGDDYTPSGDMAP